MFCTAGYSNSNYAFPPANLLICITNPNSNKNFKITWKRFIFLPQIVMIKMAILVPTVKPYFAFKSASANSLSSLRPSPHLRTLSADSPHTLQGHIVHRMFEYRSPTIIFVHTYLVCPVNQATSWNAVAAGIWALYIFVMRRNKTAKLRETFVDKTFVQRWYSSRKLHSSRVTHTRWLMIREFRQNYERILWGSAPENLLQNPQEWYKILRSNSSFGQTGRSAPIFSQWWSFSHVPLCQYNKK